MMGSCEPREAITSRRPLVVLVFCTSYAFIGGTLCANAKTIVMQLPFCKTKGSLYTLKWGLPAKNGGLFLFLQNHVPLFETGHALRKQASEKKVDVLLGWMQGSIGSHFASQEAFMFLVYGQPGSPYRSCRIIRIFVLCVLLVLSPFGIFCLFFC